MGHRPHHEDRDACAVADREEEWDQFPRGDDQKADDGKEEQRELVGGVVPGRQHRIGPARRERLAHPNHHHVLRRREQEIDERNLEAPDCVDGEGRRAHGRGDHVVVEVGQQHQEHDAEQERERIGDLLPQRRAVGPELTPELPSDVDERPDEANRTEHHRAGEQRLESSEGDGRGQQGDGPEHVGKGVGDPGAEVALAGGHHDLQHRGGQRDQQPGADQPRQPRQRGVAQPARETRARHDEEPRAHEPAGHQHQQRVHDVAPAATRRIRQEVQQAIGHPELGDHGEGRVHQHELLVRAELREVEDSRQHHRSRERHRKGNRPARGQEEDRPGAQFRGRRRGGRHLERVDDVDATLFRGGGRSRAHGLVRHPTVGSRALRRHSSNVRIAIGSSTTRSRRFACPSSAIPRSRRQES